MAKSGVGRWAGKTGAIPFKYHSFLRLFSVSPAFCDLNGVCFSKIRSAEKLAHGNNYFSDTL